MFSVSVTAALRPARTGGRISSFITRRRGGGTGGIASCACSRSGGRPTECRTSGGRGLLRRRWRRRRNRSRFRSILLLRRAQFLGDLGFQRVELAELGLFAGQDVGLDHAVDFLVG